MHNNLTENTSVLKHFTNLVKKNKLLTLKKKFNICHNMLGFYIRNEDILLGESDSA
jgi:hypothetical protein